MKFPNMHTWGSNSAAMARKNVQLHFERLQQASLVVKTLGVRRDDEVDETEGERCDVTWYWTIAVQCNCCTYPGNMVEHK